MATLAVLAHYDRDGLVAPHVARQLRWLRPLADRLVLVSAGRLFDEVPDADEVIERDNTGYDFGSWRAGLEAVPDWTGYDRLILSNDSFVGPLVPPERLLGGADAQLYGITISPQVVRHVQSYFMVFDATALRHPALADFWRAMRPLDDRGAVIGAYELGLGRLGLTLGSYFTPTRHEERLMAARMAAHHRRGPSRAAAHAAAYALQPVRRVVESPVLGLWDRVFDRARLPVVKVSLFTRNPYRIDRAAVLERLQASFPEDFAGFADYLRRVGGL